MEIMLDGQLITCTPEEYMKLKSLGAFGGTSAGTSTEKPLPQQEYDSLEKRIRDLEKERDSYPDWIKRGQREIVAVYGCNIPSPTDTPYWQGQHSLTPDIFSIKSDISKPNITIEQNSGVSPDVSDALALTIMTGNTTGLSAQAMDTLNAVVGAAPSPTQSEAKGDDVQETDKQPTLESENDPTEAYVLSANDELGRMIFISSICPAQYSYRISRALTFKTPEDARNSIAPLTSSYPWIPKFLREVLAELRLTSSYPWIPMPLPSKEARDAIDKRADSYISNNATEE